MSTRYSLKAAARQLRIHPATLRFWEECFHDELAATRDDDGEPTFSKRELEAIRQVERIVLGEGKPLEEARRIVFAPFDETPDHAHPAPSSWTKEIDQLKSAVSNLSDQVALLLDESRSLQQLFTRLIDMIEPALKSNLPVATESEMKKEARDVEAVHDEVMDVIPKEDEFLAELRRFEAAELNGNHAHNHPD